MRCATQPSTGGGGPQWAKWLLVGLLVLPAGCSRRLMRTQADFDTYNILAEKSMHPLWDLPRLSVQPDPRSRFYDPYNPDCEPLPPDDPAAHVHMHWVDTWEGYKGWHKFGRTLSVENPHWLAAFGLTPEMLDTPETVPSPAIYETEGDNDAPADPDAVNLDLPLPPAPDGSTTGGAPICRPLPALNDLTLHQVIELANIHSREYQFEIENVYLQALNLTFDRYQFDVRYLGIGGGEPSVDLDYINLPGRSDSLALASRFGISQLLPSGAQWALELANDTLWVFSGPGASGTASLLSWSLVQPLARGAGRKVVLEGLTQSERNVLYAIRDLARFRQLFFVDLVAGGGNVSFLGILQQVQQIQNTLANISEIELQIERLRATTAPQVRVPLAALPPNLEFPPEVSEQILFNEDLELLYWFGNMTGEQAGILRKLSNDPAYQVAVQRIIAEAATEVTTLDVAQLESRLANTQQQLRNSERALADSLDQYKLQLGLPTDMPISLDRSFLKQFELIEPELTRLERVIMDYVQEWARISDVDPEPELILRVIAGLQDLAEQVRDAGLTTVARDFERVDEALPERLRRLPDDASREAVEEFIARERVQFQDVQETFQTLVEDLEELRQLATEPDLTLEQRLDLRRLVEIAREDLLRITRGLRVRQIGLRTELVTLPEFTMTMEEAVACGLANRVDLMNVRAQVMDARRKVEVAANQLESVLDLVATGDIASADRDNPFDFRRTLSAYRLGVRFTAPLDIRAERNAYRAALIEYQRARRDYMAFEDQVKLQIRQAWRQIAVLSENFETARLALRLAALQLDQAVELTGAPGQAGGQPGGGGGGGGRGGGTSGLNLLNALQSILQSQNSIIDIWVDYERNRLNIYRDMGIMEIDERGLWTDPFYQSFVTPAPSHDVPPLPGDSGDATTHLERLAYVPGLAELLHADYEAADEEEGSGHAALVDGPVDSAGSRGLRAAVGPREFQPAPDLLRSGDGRREARPVSDHGDGARAPGQPQELDPHQYR